MIATVSSDALYQGSLGLALGVCVLTGKSPLPKDWSKENREFYLKLVVITKENAKQYMGEPKQTDYVGDWECDKLWSRNTGKAF